MRYTKLANQLIHDGRDRFEIVDELLKAGAHSAVAQEWGDERYKREQLQLRRDRKKKSKTRRGRQGTHYGGVIFSEIVPVVRSDRSPEQWRVYHYHATKGWRSRRHVVNPTKKQTKLLLRQLGTKHGVRHPKPKKGS